MDDRRIIYTPLTERKKVYGVPREWLYVFIFAGPIFVGITQQPLMLPIGVGIGYVIGLVAVRLDPDFMATFAVTTKLPKAELDRGTRRYRA